MPEYGFLWTVFSHIRTESSILKTTTYTEKYGSENARILAGIFYTVVAPTEIGNSAAIKY